MALSESAVFETINHIIFLESLKKIIPQIRCFFFKTSPNIPKDPNTKHEHGGLKRGSNGIGYLKPSSAILEIIRPTTKLLPTSCDAMRHLRRVTSDAREAPESTSQLRLRPGATV